MYMYYYYAGISILGLVLNLIMNAAAKKHGHPKREYLLKLTAIAGGGLGMVLSDLLLSLFEKRPNFRKIHDPAERDDARHHYNKMRNAELYITVYAAAWAVLHGEVCYLLLSGRKNHVIAWMENFYQGHTGLCMYLAAVNVLTFALFLLDKVFAMAHRWRVSERILLLVSFLGGALGGYLAMDLFNHKVSSREFASGLPMLIFVQIFLLVLL